MSVLALWKTFFLAVLLGCQMFTELFLLRLQTVVCRDDLLLDILVNIPFFYQQFPFPQAPAFSLYVSSKEVKAVQAITSLCLCPLSSQVFFGMLFACMQKEADREDDDPPWKSIQGWGWWLPSFSLLQVQSLTVMEICQEVVKYLPTFFRWHLYERKLILNKTVIPSSML